MEVTINYNGQAVAVEVTLEVYEFLVFAPQGPRRINWPTRERPALPRRP